MRRQLKLYVQRQMANAMEMVSHDDRNQVVQRVLQCVAGCCKVLQDVAVWYSVVQHAAV